MIQIQRLTAASLVKLRAARYEGELHHSLSTYAMACRFGWYQLAPGPHNPMLDSTCLLSFGNPDPAWRHQYGAEPGWRTDPARNQAIQGVGSDLLAAHFCVCSRPRSRLVCLKTRLRSKFMI